MRVLIIDKTAVLEAAHERFEKLARQPEIDLAVLSPVHWDEHMREVLAERTAHPDYRIYLGKTGWTGSYSRGFYRTGLKGALRDFQPDVVHLLEEPWSFFAGQAARQRTRIVPDAKLLFYTWENIFRENTYCSKLDPIHKRIERRVFADSNAGVCATRLAATVLESRGFQGRTPVIPYGVGDHFLVSEERIHEQATRPVTQSPRVGYVGRVLEMKGIDTLLHALARTEGTLTVLGTGEEERNLKSLASDLGVSERVEWSPPVPPDRVVETMSGFDLLVLPSRTTPTWAEQLGRVLLESMACGVPVVGSSSGSIPEVVGEAGLVFEEGNPEALSEAMSRLSTDVDLRKGNVLAGYEKIRGRYTWDRFASDLADLYRELAG